MSDELILYIGEKNISSWSMRGWLSLKHKGLAFEERMISLIEDRDRSQRRRISPTGRVPVLIHGERVIPDSLAIIEYLEETFPSPAHPALWPTDPARRAHARWLAAEMHSGFSRLRESMAFHRCFYEKPPAPTGEALSEAATMLSLLEWALQEHGGDGPFLFGEFCAADIFYVPAVVRLTAFRVPTDEAPKAAAYMKRLLEHRPVRLWMDPARALPPADRYD